eukprot:CAMPEP_0204574906 /NCGR_PEP_ID=MMETSP0661-20131031/40877_1 /ASSEMBLY_ACC=CAM_ASM_000606 /TAXON_ID=109239 /ORGANISM="Alexandrium margalefi, Strain AMGDE01CS-322" /LENGTH=223 /DNA_ID=CAMNT_0051583479 /DNA_START=54 /DNA_END=722 /DNA_ORIENTATION=-
MPITVFRIGGEEARLEDLGPGGTLALLRQRVEEVTGVPQSRQCLTFGSVVLQNSDPDASLALLGVGDGAQLSLVQIAFPEGRFEYYHKLPSMFLDDDDDFEIAENMRLEVDASGGLSLRFKGDYDMGTHAADFAGAIREARGGGIFSAVFSRQGPLQCPAADREFADRLKGNAPFSVLLTLTEDAGSVGGLLLRADEGMLEARPFDAGATWTLLRVSAWEHEW